MIACLFQGDDVEVCLSVCGLNAEPPGLVALLGCGGQAPCMQACEQG